MSGEPTTFDAIVSELATASFRVQLAFGIGLLERSLPEYFQFQQETGWLGGGDLRAALALCWKTLEEETTPGGVEIDLLLQRCERWMPDSEDHASPYTSAAINAVDITCHLLDHLRAITPRGVIDAAGARRDTIDLFIQAESNVGKKAQHDISAHPLMRAELAAMQGDIQAIATASDDTMAIRLLARIRSQHYAELQLKVL